MASEWTETTLGEVADLRNGAGIKQVEYSKTGIPLVRVSNFTSHSISMNGCLFVNKLHAQRWSEHRLREGDLLVATVGSWPPNWSSVVGKAVRVPGEASGALQNQNTCAVLAKPSKADQRFLFYQLKTEEFAHYAANAAAGSANQARLPVTKLGKFVFQLPHIDEQREIAATLGSLDDRIQLLQEQNETLEAIVGAIFKSWFVDFDPVRAKAEGREPEGMDAATAALFPSEFQESTLGPIPKDWRVGKVRDLGAVICGKTPPTAVKEYYGDEVPFITIPDMNGRVFAHETARKLSSKGADFQRLKYLPARSICVSCIATVGLVSLTSEPSQTNQQINSVVPNGEFPNYFSFFTLRNLGDDIRSAGSGGSVFGRAVLSLSLCSYLRRP